MSSDAGQPGAPRPRAILIGHGDFAAGMLSAVERIAGRGELLLAVSAQELSLAQIEQTLRDHLATTGAGVIFTDLQAGSATMAARKALRDHPRVVLVVGANLPMLLDFVLSSTANAGEAAQHAVERGRSAIAVYGGAA
jgi:PTS system N-acetylgalactosamine-specific IIA component